jgi:CMP/dCMP kinase
MAGGFVIAIDGPSAAGKGTLAENLARHYGLPYLDTGLLYRAIGRLAKEAGVDLDDARAVTPIAKGLQPQDLARSDLRGREAGEVASRVAVHAAVRDALTDFQRNFAAQDRGAVLDGRDIGTVICPDADVKLFVTASAAVRARRRTDELNAKGRAVDYATILARATAPLKPASDAFIIDTSDLDREGALLAAIRVIDRRRP